MADLTKSNLYKITAWRDNSIKIVSHLFVDKNKNHIDISSTHKIKYGFIYDEDNNNFITDISALSNSNITTLNITNLMLISDKQLLELVKSLPNLEKIVGLEVNNATMYSDELVEFCKEHDI